MCHYPVTATCFHNKQCSVNLQTYWGEIFHYFYVFFCLLFSSISAFHCNKIDCENTLIGPVAWSAYLPHVWSDVPRWNLPLWYMTSACDSNYRLKSINGWLKITFKWFTWPIIAASKHWIIHLFLLRVPERYWFNIHYSGLEIFASGTLIHQNDSPGRNPACFSDDGKAYILLWQPMVAFRRCLMKPQDTARTTFSPNTEGIRHKAFWTVALVNVWTGCVGHIHVSTLMDSLISTLSVLRSTFYLERWNNGD